MNPVEDVSILAVDDEPDNLRLLATILRSEGAVVRAATSGEIALDSMRKFPPNLALLDIGLPNIDGFEVAAQMQAHPELRNVPVIFLSGRTALADKIQAFSVGAVDYIEKPFQTAEVIARVRTHLDLTRRRQEEGRRAEMLEVLLKERELLLAQRERFNAMVVHDMRSPLQVLVGFVEQARYGTISPDGIDRASAACDALAELTTNALEISRVSSGAMPLSQRRVKAQSIVESALRLFESEVEPELLVAEGTAWADDYVLVRVLLNLLDNAVEHGAEPVTVSASRQGDMVRFEVSDSGQGIDSFGPDVFSLFVSRHAEAANHGVGLAFCRAAVVAHGGELGVQSSPLGGAQFWFTVPAVDAFRVTGSHNGEPVSARGG